MAYIKVAAPSAWCVIMKDTCRKSCIFSASDLSNAESWKCKLELVVDNLITESQKRELSELTNLLRMANEAEAQQEEKAVPQEEDNRLSAALAQSHRGRWPKKG